MCDFDWPECVTGASQDISYNYTLSILELSEYFKNLVLRR